MPTKVTRCEVCGSSPKICTDQIGVWECAECAGGRDKAAREKLTAKAREDTPGMGETMARLNVSGWIVERERGG